MVVVGLMLGYALLAGALLTPMLDALGPWITIPCVLVGWFVIIGIGVEYDHHGSLNLQRLRRAARDGVAFFGLWTMYMVGLFAAALVLYIALRFMGFYAGSD